MIKNYGENDWKILLRKVGFNEAQILKMSIKEQRKYVKFYYKRVYNERGASLLFHYIRRPISQIHRKFMRGE